MSEAAGANPVVGAAAAALRATIASPIPDRLLAAPDNTSGFSSYERHLLTSSKDPADTEVRRYFRPGVGLTSPKATATRDG